MARKIITIYIDDSSIRLLVVRGGTVRKYASLPLEEGAVQGAVIVKEVEVAGRVREILKSQRVRAKKVVVGLSGLLCLTRPILLPQLPRSILAEAVMREAKRILPINLEQFYITWHIISAPPGKIQVFLTAVRRQSADAVVKTLRLAGLNPRIMDLKPLALGRLTPDRTAITVDIQPREFDIIITSQGIPQPIRTLSFPGEAKSLQDKLPIVRAELERTVSFFNSNNPENPITPDVSVYLSGELAGRPELGGALTGTLGNPVLDLPSPISCPEGMDCSYYMANIGLALQDTSLEKFAGPLVPTGNILPVAYRPKPISWGRVVAVPASVVVIGLLVPLAMFTQAAAGNIDSVRGKLDATNSILQQKSIEKQKLKQDVVQLEKTVAEAEASRDKFTRALDSLNRRSSELQESMGVAVEVLPDGVSLVSLNYSGNILKVGGVTADKEKVLSYARNLLAGEKFSEVTVSSISAVGKEGVQFMLILKVRG